MLLRHCIFFLQNFFKISALADIWRPFWGNWSHSDLRWCWDERAYFSPQLNRAATNWSEVNSTNNIIRRALDSKNILHFTFPVAAQYCTDRMQCDTTGHFFEMGFFSSSMPNPVPKARKTLTNPHQLRKPTRQFVDVFSKSLAARLLLFFYMLI